MDLFYSITHAHLLASVEVCITQPNDELAFNNRCGVSVESSLELLGFYLSTSVGWMIRFTHSDLDLEFAMGTG